MDEAKEAVHRGLPPVPNHVAPTEDAVAAAFAEANAGRIVFDQTVGAWFIWRDGRWQRDNRNGVFHDARLFARAVRDRLSDPPSGLAKIAFVAAVEKACRSDPKLSISSEVWDRDRWLLGTPGGVIDLRTGNTRSASPDLYISRHTAVAPAPAQTPAPIWRAFLAAATGGDASLQVFLQRLVGYWLTGDVTEEVLTFLYGIGGSGKGTFLGAITGILADYAVSVPIEAFTTNGRINLEYYRAAMAGARLVTASETENQAMWAESQIKELTGNETPLSARHPYGRPFTFWPQFKIALVGNYAPKLKGRSAAMERRLRIVPFDNAPERPDSQLKEKLRAEFPAILRWGIDGCILWQRHRLGTAEAVRRATATYFEAQDAFQHWLDERCVLDKSLSSKPGPLCADYNQWAKTSGEGSVSSNAFAELLDRTPGLKRERTSGVRLVRGIGLKPPLGGHYSDGSDG